MEPMLLLVVLTYFIGGIVAIVLVGPRYKTCPSDQILVVSGKLRKRGVDNQGAPLTVKYIKNGGTFIVPILQTYKYLNLAPIVINIELKHALLKQGMKANINAKFTVAVSPEEGVMEKAAEHLLDLSQEEIQELACSIISSQLHHSLAMCELKEISSSRDKFLSAISDRTEEKIRQIGLKLIKADLQDISEDF